MSGLLGMQRFAQVTALSLLGLTGGATVANAQKQDTSTPEPKIAYKAACERMKSDVNFVLAHPGMINEDKQAKINLTSNYWKFSSSTRSTPGQQVVRHDNLKTLERIQQRGLQIIKETDDYDSKKWFLISLVSALFFGISTAYWSWKDTKDYDAGEAETLRVKAAGTATPVSIALTLMSLVAMVVSLAISPHDNYKEVHPTLPDDVCDQIRPDRPSTKKNPPQPLPKKDRRTRRLQ